MHKYEEIRAELVRRINDQTWPVDFLIPQEDELAEEFGVARGTIRQALVSLVETGLLVRKRRAGTRVARPLMHASTLRIAMVRHEIEQKGFEYGYRLLESSKSHASATRSENTPTHSNTSVLHVVCLHLANGKPYQLEDRRISLSAIPNAANSDFTQTSPNEWLIQQQAYSSVRTEFMAARPSALELKHLDLSQEEPVFVIERETYLEKAWLTRVRLSHPATSFKITTVTEGV